jgi:dTDP-4-dehydrorhamnose 3,5-epimerase
MQFTEGPLPGLLVAEAALLTDERGYFFESFHAERFAAAGIAGPFVQDNQSLSNRGVLRGLHFQNPPHAQGKLVRVIRGAALDVVVDIRKDSPSYGQHFKIVLDDRTHRMLWVPPGFAHGFVALEDQTVFYYKCTAYYHRPSEGGVLWNDPALGIDWETDRPTVSAKDRALASFDSFVNGF